MLDTHMVKQRERGAMARGAATAGMGADRAIRTLCVELVLLVVTRDKRSFCGRIAIQVASSSSRGAFGVTAESIFFVCLNVLEANRQSLPPPSRSHSTTT